MFKDNFSRFMLKQENKHKTYEYKSLYLYVSNHNCIKYSKYFDFCILILCTFRASRSV